ncbi:hypothetical protein LTR53_008858 [Teratosphaeriaceae sp. CCFEE 6253]|nr:hypothetical protein LTR53_008858 [Teratosphaeriaceae sp. CCFEE 6253]
MASYYTNTVLYMYLFACLPGIAYVSGSCDDYQTNTPCPVFKAANAPFLDWDAVEGISHILAGIGDNSVWASSKLIACEPGLDDQIVCAFYQGQDPTNTRLGSQITADIEVIRSMGCSTCGWSDLDGGRQFIVTLYPQASTFDCDGICWSNAVASTPAASTFVTSTMSATPTSDATGGSARPTESTNPQGPRKYLDLSLADFLSRVIPIAIGIPSAALACCSIWRRCKGR